MHGKLFNIHPVAQRVDISSDHSAERQSEKPQEPRKTGTKINDLHICTRDLHSFLSFAHCRAASTFIPLLLKATFTPSIQPNLGQRRTRPPLTSAINTLLSLRYSSILSTWPHPEWPYMLCVGLAFRRSHVRGSLSAACLEICSPLCTVQYAELGWHCPVKGMGCDQSIGSTVSDAIVRCCLWSIGTGAPH